MNLRMQSEVLHNDIGNIRGITLISSPNYQRQVFIIPPGVKIPPHNHRNVRTAITFLAGCMTFKKSDREIELKSPIDSGRCFIIDEGEMHEAINHGQYSIFTTEQYWLNDEPVVSLQLNWHNGSPINKEHEEQLKSRAA